MHSSPATSLRPAQITQPTQERLSLMHVVILAGMHVLGLFALLHPSWTGFGALLVGHFLTGCLGVSIGYHRLLSHQSFKTSPFLRGVLALFGTLSFQGGPIVWSTYHRSHHANSDRTGDPHSSLRGFIWSHFSWMLYRSPNGFSRVAMRRTMSDLESSAWLRFLDRNIVWINIGAALAFWWVTGDLYLTLWAFPLRIVSLWHSTWFVNSAAHGARGKREYDPNIETARNVWWVAALTYGEGWHRNHHMSPRSVSFQREWWQIDPGFYFVTLFKKMGLAHR